MMHNMLQQAANNAIAMGPTVLVQGMQLQRPIDVVKSPYYAVDSKPALRQLPGTEPVSIDEVQSALKELDRRYGI